MKNCKFFAKKIVTDNISVRCCCHSGDEKECVCCVGRNPDDYRPLLYDPLPQAEATGFLENQDIVLTRNTTTEDCCDKYEWKIFNESGGGGGGGGFNTNVLVNKTVFVDVKYGDDLTGKVEDMDKPFQTIQAAIDAAVAAPISSLALIQPRAEPVNWTVYIRPGLYTDNKILLKNNVNLFFEEGAISDNSANTSSTDYTFTDNNTRVNCSITGFGDFICAINLFKLGFRSNILIEGKNFTLVHNGPVDDFGMFDINGSNLKISGINFICGNRNIFNISGDFENTIIIDGQNMSSNGKCINISDYSGTINFTFNTITGTINIDNTILTSIMKMNLKAQYLNYNSLSPTLSNSLITINNLFYDDINNLPSIVNFDFQSINYFSRVMNLFQTIPLIPIYSRVNFIAENLTPNNIENTDPVFEINGTLLVNITFDKCSYYLSNNPYDDPNYAFVIENAAIVDIKAKQILDISPLTGGGGSVFSISSLAKPFTSTLVVSATTIFSYNSILTTLPEPISTNIFPVNVNIDALDISSNFKNQLAIIYLDGDTSKCFINIDNFTIISSELIPPITTTPPIPTTPPTILFYLNNGSSFFNIRHLSFSSINSTLFYTSADASLSLDSSLITSRTFINTPINPPTFIFSYYVTFFDLSGNFTCDINTIEHPINTLYPPETTIIKNDIIKTSLAAVANVKIINIVCANKNNILNLTDNSEISGTILNITCQFSTVVLHTSTGDLKLLFDTIQHVEFSDPNLDPMVTINLIGNVLQGQYGKIFMTGNKIENLYGDQVNKILIQVGLPLVPNYNGNPQMFLKVNEINMFIARRIGNVKSGNLNIEFITINAALFSETLFACDDAENLQLVGNVVNATKTRNIPMGFFIHSTGTSFVTTNIQVVNASSSGQTQIYDFIYLDSLILVDNLPALNASINIHVIFVSNISNSLLHATQGNVQFFGDAITCVGFQTLSDACIFLENTSNNDNKYFINYGIVSLDQYENVLSVSNNGVYGSIECIWNSNNTTFTFSTLGISILNSTFIMASKILNLSTSGGNSAIGITINNENNLQVELNIDQILFDRMKNMILLMGNLKFNNNTVFNTISIFETGIIVNNTVGGNASNLEIYAGDLNFDGSTANFYLVDLQDSSNIEIYFDNMQINQATLITSSSSGNIVIQSNTLATSGTIITNPVIDINNAESFSFNCNNIDIQNSINISGVNRVIITGIVLNKNDVFLQSLFIIDNVGGCNINISTINAANIVNIMDAMNDLDSNRIIFTCNTLNCDGVTNSGFFIHPSETCKLNIGIVNFNPSFNTANIPFISLQDGVYNNTSIEAKINTANLMGPLILSTATGKIIIDISLLNVLNTDYVIDINGATSALLSINDFNMSNITSSVNAISFSNIVETSLLSGTNLTIDNIFKINTVFIYNSFADCVDQLNFTNINCNFCDHIIYKTNSNTLYFNFDTLIAENIINSALFNDSTGTMIVQGDIVNVNLVTGDGNVPFILLNKNSSCNFEGYFNNVKNYGLALLIQSDGDVTYRSNFTTITHTNNVNVITINNAASNNKIRNFGGYMKTENGSFCIEYVPATPNTIRLSSSTLVSIGVSIQEDNAGTLTVIAEKSIAKQNYTPTITVIPATVDQIKIDGAVE